MPEGIESKCGFYVLPVNEIRLLGMQDCKSLQLLSVISNKIKADDNRGQVNEGCKQDKSKINRDLKIKLPLDGKNN